MKKILQIILIIISVSSLCYASEDHFEELIKAKSLKCYFGPGASANWKGKKVKVELTVMSGPRPNRAATILKV